jgi:hypothetical protein
MLARADAFGLQTADLDFKGKAKVVYRLSVAGRAGDMAGQEPGHGCEVVAFRDAVHTVVHEQRCDCKPIRFIIMC